MHFHPALVEQLDSLTAALDDPGTDLQAVLSVLADDLALGVPSFLGLDVTMFVNDRAVVITAFSGSADPVRASISMPMAALVDAERRSIATFFAGAAHAFDELAEFTRRTLALDGQVRVDQHLHPERRDSGMSGLTELLEFHQAIGVLIGSGRTPEQARAELRSRGQALGLTEAELVEQILARTMDPGEQ